MAITLLHPGPQSGNCRRGDACPFAHGVFECWLHPSRYRTQVGIKCSRCSPCCSRWRAQALKARLLLCSDRGPSWPLLTLSLSICLKRVWGAVYAAPRRHCKPPNNPHIFPLVSASPLCLLLSCILTCARATDVFRRHGVQAPRLLLCARRERAAQARR